MLYAVPIARVIFTVTFPEKRISYSIYSGIKLYFCLSFLGCRLAEKGLLRRAVITWCNAAGAGNASSHFNLAICYQRGLDVSRDAEKVMFDDNCFLSC